VTIPEKDGCQERGRQAAVLTGEVRSFTRMSIVESLFVPGLPAPILRGLPVPIDKPEKMPDTVEHF
jgi:hypothetical protein